MDQRDAPATGDGPAPHLDESVRRIGRGARDVVRASKDTGRALRRLASADFALARSALGRGLAWTGVAVVFGASAWLLTCATLIALLRNVFEWSWLASISSTAALSLAVALLASWRVMVFFDYAGMHATRRQLARLGLADEPGVDDDEDAAPFPAADPPPAPPGATMPPEPPVHRP